MISEIYGNIDYPDSSLTLRSEGLAVIYFMVNENGELGDIGVAKSVDKWIDKEAI